MHPTCMAESDVLSAQVADSNKDGKVSFEEWTDAMRVENMSGEEVDEVVTEFMKELNK